MQFGAFAIGRLMELFLELCRCHIWTSPLGAPAGVGRAESGQHAAAAAAAAVDAAAVAGWLGAAFSRSDRACISTANDMSAHCVTTYLFTPARSKPQSDSQGDLTPPKACLAM